MWYNKGTISNRILVKWAKPRKEPIMKNRIEILNDYESIVVALKALHAERWLGNFSLDIGIGCGEYDLLAKPVKSLFAEGIREIDLGFIKICEPIFKSGYFEFCIVVK